MEAYNEALDLMKKEDVGAYEDFIGRDTTKFCKVFFDDNTVSDMHLNNTSESFNGYILNARGMHVIHMLEQIRTSLMSRITRKRLELVDYQHSICPAILEKVQEAQHYSRNCITHPASDVLFEVEHYEDRFVVDVGLRTCTCRLWNLTGIPCIHGCAALHFLRRDPVDYVHSRFTVDTYYAIYAFGLPPLNGEKMWPVAQGYPVIPPAVKKMPGRPKKKRKRDPCEENPKNATKLRKNGVRMVCQNCFQAGHNKRGCKNQAVPKPPPAQVSICLVFIFLICVLHVK